MWFNVYSVLQFLSVFSAASAQTSEPGYSLDTPSTVTNKSFSFGEHYAVLNLDLIEGLVSSMNTTKAGKSFIKNTATWIDAVHKQDPAPLNVFTRIYFSNSWRPEISPSTPFMKAIDKLGNVTEKSPESQIYHAFKPSEEDVVLRKIRYYAGAGNSLEEILSANKIDTVVLPISYILTGQSGLRLSGVIFATASRLFDLDYNVYVIANNTIESPPNTEGVYEGILQGVFPKMPVNVITLEQAIGALKRSKPALR